ncbi:MAG: GWxTD domain-containing protein [Chlorobiota bacterium]
MGRWAVRLCLCAALLWGESAAQQDTELLGRYFLGQFGEGWFAELYALPEGADSIRVVVLVRIAYAVLPFEQETIRGGFRASVQLGAELVDTVGIVRRRLEVRDTLWVQQYEATLSRDSTWVRAIEVVIPASVHRCRLQLLLAHREVRRQDLPVSRQQWKAPLFASASEQGVIVPFVLGGAIPFGVNTVRLLLWDARLQPGQSYRYRCRQLPPTGGERWWDSTPELSAGLVAQGPGRLERIEHPLPRYRLRSDSGIGAWIESLLTTAELVPGRYELLLWRDEQPEDTLRWEFRVVWATMPLSLRRISYAVQSMYYLLTKEAWSRLRSGSQQEQWRKIWQYWKQRDPTPATAYNEAMAVYFRRVDYAYFAFQSVAEPDGAQTERGKIYILYGPPTHLHRELPPDGPPRELWTYERLRQRFLFELRPDGRWRLVSIEHL